MHLSPTSKLGYLSFNQYMALAYDPVYDRYKFSNREQSETNLTDNNPKCDCVCECVSDYMKIYHDRFRTFTDTLRMKRDS